MSPFPSRQLPACRAAHVTVVIPPSSSFLTDPAITLMKLNFPNVTDTLGSTCLTSVPSQIERQIILIYTVYTWDTDVMPPWATSLAPAAPPSRSTLSKLPWVSFCVLYGSETKSKTRNPKTLHCLKLNNNWFFVVVVVVKNQQHR